MLEAHGGRLGPLELMSNSLPRAQSWKEAKQGSSESNFWPCPRWWAQSWLQLHRAFCTPLNSPCGFCRSQGWVGRENFSYLWLLWFQKKKNGFCHFLYQEPCVDSSLLLLSSDRRQDQSFPISVVGLSRPIWALLTPNRTSQPVSTTAGGVGEFPNCCWLNEHDC